MADVSDGSGSGGSSSGGGTTATGVWVHVDWGIPATSNPLFKPVLGPFTGEGVVKLRAAGITEYPSEQEAAKAPAQKISKQQGDVILATEIAGQGVGQGFFGLGQDFQNAPAQAFGDIASGLGLTEIGHYVGDFVTHLTDGAMWRSLGWLALGLVLMIVGILMLLRKQDLIPDVLPVPV